MVKEKSHQSEFLNFWKMLEKSYFDFCCAQRGKFFEYPIEGCLAVEARFIGQTQKGQFF